MRTKLGVVLATTVLVQAGWAQAEDGSAAPATTVVVAPASDVAPVLEALREAPAQPAAPTAPGSPAGVQTAPAAPHASPSTADASSAYWMQRIEGELRESRGGAADGPRDPGLMAGGIVIMSMGVAGGVAAAVAASNVETSGFMDFSAVPFVFAALGSFGVGLGLGIPMTVSGARSEKPAPSATPKVRVGLTSISATWTY